MLFSVEHAFVGRDEKRAPLKTPAWEASFKGNQGGRLPQEFFWFSFDSLKSPFLGLRVIQTGYWPDFNLESVFMIKMYLIRKI